MRTRLILAGLILALGCPSDDTSDSGGEGNESSGGASTSEATESTEPPDSSESSGGLVTNDCGTFNPTSPATA